VGSRAVSVRAAVAVPLALLLPACASGRAPTASSKAPPSEPPASAAPSANPASLASVDSSAVSPRDASLADRPDARDERIHAELSERFSADPRAVAAALDLFARTGDEADLNDAQTMEGGWRGELHLVPQLPAGRYETHLEWVRAAAIDHDAFLSTVTREAQSSVRYRWHPLTFRFFRSVGGHRPSAYAEGWTIAYNVEGSLNLDANAVRETLFHEMFHLNDAAHGDWSVGALKATFDRLVAKCGTRVDCLAPYAPSGTRVRGGTYYAFQPNNGESVHEYAAELALRYYREERSVLAGEPPTKHPFKCGPDENARSWRLLVDEFFGGFDRVPAC
jgi:hypothetical protein